MLETETGFIMFRQILVVASLVCVVLAAQKRYSGYRVYRLTPTLSQLRTLEQLDGEAGYDFWSRSRVVGHPIDLMVSPERIVDIEAFLDDQQIDYQIIIHDVEQIFRVERMRQAAPPAPRDGSRISFTKYHRHSQINQYLSELATRYPNLVSVDTIGKSYESRDINVIKISSGGSGTRPVILIDAGIHAREWIAPAMALYIINQLVENEANSDLISKVDWHIIPLLNVDGYEYSHVSDRMWRKTRSRNSGSQCRGVDGNRNFGFHWMEVGASSNPCQETYAGNMAFSEPETASLQSYAMTVKNRAKLYVTFHSYGNYFLYPWGYTSALPSDWKALDDLARKANAAQKAAGGKSYTIGSSTNVLYAAAGGSDDWMKGVANITLSYTVELPGGGWNGFDLPASAIATTVKQFFEAVRVFGKHVADSY